MIPKIIHFVWIGGAEKPQTALDCIASWKKFCPGYEIMEWGNREFGEIDNRYAKEAFAAKKFAFASDVIRLHALKRYGGLYMDSDVLATAPMDGFLHHDFFIGLEKYGNQEPSPMTALMGAGKDNPIISALLAEYDGISFIGSDGAFDTTTNVVRITKHFHEKFGLRGYDGGKTVFLSEGSVIYPYWYFCAPVDSRENYSVHLYSGSWLDSYARKSKLKLGRLEIVRFRKIREGRNYPLMHGEKILLTLPLRPSGNKQLAVLWKGGGETTQ